MTHISMRVNSYVGQHRSRISLTLVVIGIILTAIAAYSTTLAQALAAIF